MKTWLLCIYPVYAPNLRGFHVYIGIAGWRWWGWEFARGTVRRLSRYVVVA